MPRSTSRRRGKGALYKYRTKAGERWRWQIYEPVDPAEPEGEFRRSGKGGYLTADAADDGLREAITKMKTQMRAVTPRGMTFGTYGREWIAALEVAPSTAAGYERLFRLYLVPKLGGLLLTGITASRLKSHYAQLRVGGGRSDRELSPNTVRKAHVVLGAILDAAVDDGLLNANPARRTKLVKAPTEKQVREAAPEMVTWTAEQLKAFLEWDRAVYQDEHHAYWVVLAGTGMRRSEGLALKWSDLDVKNRRISIRRAADTIKIGTTKKPKSGKSRVVDIDQAIIDVLRSWKAVRGSISLDLARPDSYIFGSDSGQVINPNRATMRWSVRVAAMRKALGEDAPPALSVHGLRHTHATLLLGAGVHPKVVQERLGHGDISITMSVYSHVTETMQRDAVDRLAALMAGA